METAGAYFERCLGQAPAEVLMLGQLEASAQFIVAQSAWEPLNEPGVSSCASKWPVTVWVRLGILSRQLFSDAV